MKTEILKIEDTQEIPELKNFYADQPIDDLIQSYLLYGQLVPIHVNTELGIINGYRMVAAIRKAGGTTVEAIIMGGKPTIFDRILLNQTRVKTTVDQVNEIKEVFNRFPKRQGNKKSTDKKYNWDDIVSASLNNRWKGDITLNKLKYILNNDLDGNVLSKGIIENNWKVDTCYEFLKESKSIDEKNNYGFSEKIKKGEITVAEANKLIKKKDWLDHEYKDTFIIPGKCNSYNIDCTDISKIDTHKKSVDLIFTSPPYFILRKYQNGDTSQIGQEKTKEQYCENIARIFNALVPTLKETANVIINVGETYDNGVGYGIPQLLKHYIETKTSLIYKDTLIWSKPNPKPQNENVLRPINNVEYLLWFVVNPKKAKYNLLTYPVAGKETTISKGCKDVDKNGVVWDKNISLTNPYGKIYSHLKEQTIANIIECSIGKNHEVYKIYEEGHPAIMSALLPVVPILMTTDEGNKIFDPFSGSNVVGRMTCLLNRVALSAELSKEYFKIGCRMLEKSIEDFDKTNLELIQNEVYQNDNSSQYQLPIAA